MAETLLLVIKLAVATLIFATGLGATAGDLTYLWRRPGQLVRSLLAMYVAVPLAVSLLAKALALPAPVRLAIFVLAISAGAPLLPRKLSNLGRAGYVFSLVVTSSLIAVVAVPVWMELLGPLLGHESGLQPRTVAALIAKAFLAPLALGMILHRLLPGIAGKVSDWLLGAAAAVLAIAGLALLVLGRRMLFAVGWMPLLALAGMAVVALAIGHLVGGPDPGDRKALAVSCASRHVGVAMLAASTVHGAQITELVLAYLVAATIVTIPYLQWGLGGRHPSAAGGLKGRAGATGAPRGAGPRTA